MKSRFYIMAACSTALGLGACEDSGQSNLALDARCSLRDSCASGLACIDGRCRTLCYGDADCDGRTQHCEGGGCLDGSAFACGNERQDPGEECDDGNRDDGDGCHYDCTIEYGWFCGGAPSSCTPPCGTGRIEASEACDDGNRDDGDGCSTVCLRETNFRCEGEPSLCTHIVTLNPSDVVYVRDGVTVTATVDDDDISRVEFLRDDLVLAAILSPLVYHVDATGLAEGRYLITARALGALGTSQSLPLRMMVDRTGPVVVSQLPLASVVVGSESRTVLEVVFSEALLAASIVDDASVQVSASCGATDWTSTLSTDGFTLRFETTSPLVAPCTVTAKITALVTDLAGNAGNEVQQAWLVPQWQALTAVVSSNAGGYSLAVAPNGLPVIAYAEPPDAAASNVYVKRWTGAAWETVGSGPLGALSAASPSIVVDGDGNPTVAWIEAGTSKHIMRVAQWNSTSSTWIERTGVILGVQSAEPTLMTDPKQLAVAVPTSGTPWLAWRDGTVAYNDASGDCLQSWNATTSAWELRGCRIPGWGGNVSLQVGADDVPVFAYSWNDESAAIGLTTSLSGAASPWTFSPATAGQQPAVGANTCGVAAAWRFGMSGVLAQQRVGTTWEPTGTARVLSATKAGALPSVTIDKLGRAVVAWVEPSTGYFVKRLESSVWTDISGTFNAVPPSATLTYGPSLATTRACTNMHLAVNENGVLRVFVFN